MSKILFSCLLSMLIPVLAWADQNTQPTYTIEYTDSSPIKSVSLKNAKLRAIIYYHGIPEGIIILSTNSNQQFTIDSKYADSSNVAVQIEAVQNEENDHASCRGLAPPNHHKVLLSCKKM